MGKHLGECARTEILRACRTYCSRYDLTALQKAESGSPCPPCYTQRRLLVVQGAHD